MALTHEGAARTYPSIYLLHVAEGRNGRMLAGDLYVGVPPMVKEAARNELNRPVSDNDSGANAG